MNKYIFYVRRIILLLLLLLFSYYFIIDYINIVEYLLLGMLLILCCVPSRVKNLINSILKRLTIYYLNKEKDNTNNWLNNAKSRKNEEFSESQLYELRNMDNIAKENINVLENCLDILDIYKFDKKSVSCKAKLVNRHL